MLLCWEHISKRWDQSKLHFNSVIFQTESSCAVRSPGFACFLFSYMDVLFFLWFRLLLYFKVKRKTERTHHQLYPPKKKPHTKTKTKPCLWRKSWTQTFRKIICVFLLGGMQWEWDLLGVFPLFGDVFYCHVFSSLFGVLSPEFSKFKLPVVSGHYA